ncbi:hypothetical protein GCM10020256_58580 [Streptomyces thermocoprophilus]
MFGLGAAYYVIARRVGAAMQPVNRFMVWLLVWLVLSAGFASWQGHLGGLLVGAAVTAAYAFVPGGERRWLVQAGGVCRAADGACGVCVGQGRPADGRSGLTGPW